MELLLLMIAGWLTAAADQDELTSMTCIGPCGDTGPHDHAAAARRAETADHDEAHTR